VSGPRPIHMRDDLLLKERAAAFRADPAVQEAECQPSRELAHSDTQTGRVVSRSDRRPVRLRGVRPQDEAAHGFGFAISIRLVSSLCSALVDQPAGTAASHEPGQWRDRFSMTLVDGVRLGLALVPPLQTAGLGLIGE